MQNPIIYIAAYFLAFYFGLFCYHFFKKRNNKIIGQKILSSFSDVALNHIEIKFSESSFNGFRAESGRFVDATMYYNDEIILFLLKNNSRRGSLNASLTFVVSLNNQPLPYDTNYYRAENLFIKSDEYILKVSGIRLKKELQIYSDSLNDELKAIFRRYQDIYGL
ncbi:hypothetical protein [Flavobacterium sp. 3HN19-14]|uniref:hypothetical protein n=1 Tax=Flavobacterium sp. 3HN19-14 TaxID=3448133 RepID=UPI003EE16264